VRRPFEYSGSSRRPAWASPTIWVEELGDEPVQAIFDAHEALVARYPGF